MMRRALTGALVALFMLATPAIAMAGDYSPTTSCTAAAAARLDARVKLDTALLNTDTLDNILGADGNDSTLLDLRAALRLANERYHAAC
jgi:hypothetical protein